MNYQVIEIQREYIDSVVKLHMSAFPNFFLTFLGPGFLKEFYRSFTYDPQGIGYIALDSETQQVLGVIVGSLVPDGYFKRLLIHRWWAFCLASIGAVLRKPKVIKRLFRALFYRGESPPGPTRSLLSSLAVAPKAQGQGIGQALVKVWTNHIQRLGSQGCFLSTDAIDNDATNNLYRKLGWKLELSKKTPQGRLMNYYALDFPVSE
jgi:ribosomal protein S18 acetylase RimI-like enzyme